MVNDEQKSRARTSKSIQQPLLIFEEGVWTEQKLSLEKDSVVIGRGGTDMPCDIRLSDRRISRTHAEIYVERGHLLLRDLDSKNGTVYRMLCNFRRGEACLALTANLHNCWHTTKNGTYLNGRPIEDAVELENGDEIQIALAQRIRFVGADATVH